MAADAQSGVEQHRKPHGAMNFSTPWMRLCPAPRTYPKGNGRPPIGVERSCASYASQKALIASKAQAKDFNNQRTHCAAEVEGVQRAKSRNKSRVRTRVEHILAGVKRLWGSLRTYP